MNTNVLKKMIFGLLFLCGCSGMLAQTGEISGTVNDENGESFPGVNVFLISGKEILRTAQTDVNGRYVIKPLDAGEYTVRVHFLGYDTLQTDITVSGGKTSFRNFKMSMKATVLDGIVILPKYESMVSETMCSGKKIDYMEIKQMPSNKGDIVNIASNVTPGLMPTPDGKDVYIRGSRRGTTAYFIDDQRVIGTFGVPSLSIQGMTVYTGGIPAMYGDVTGGIVAISTKTYFSGLSQKRAMVKAYNENQMVESED
ncbi:MAG: TonB-dependent receptor [Bacteroidia bacterium]|nr:TonB-dependent receptor [Bacteroidia bacterium]